MDDKAAIQLSVSIIVILILSIVIFAGGLYMTSQFFNFATKTEARITAQTQKEIEGRIIQSGEPVSIPFNRADLLIGESHSFGVGVLNTFRKDETFNVEMSFANAFDTQTQEKLDLPDQAYINENWIFTSIPPIERLGRNEVSVVPLSVSIGDQMAPGTPTKRDTTYVFNVCVYPLSVSSPSGLCKEDPIPVEQRRQNLHGAKVGKIYVQVN